MNGRTMAMAIAISRICVALAVAALPALVASAQVPPDMQIVTETAAYIKPGAMTPLTVLPVGTAVRLIREADGWCQVEFKDKKWGPRVGYVRSEALAALKLPTPPATTSAAPPPIPVDTPARLETPISSPRPAPSSPPPTPVSDTRESKKPGSSGEVKNIKIRGYVTNVNSPTEFEIEDYKITRDREFVLDFENLDPELRFNLDDIRVGIELEIRGLYNETTGDLTAKSIKVDMEQFKSIKQTAIISRPPTGVSRAQGGWIGEFLVDGQRVVVSPTTQTVFKLTSREKKAAKESKSEDSEEDGFQPLSSLEQITIGMAMTYEGKRRPEDGAIQATRVEFVNNDLEGGEAKLWKSLKASSKPGQAFAPGELKIDKVGKFKLLPNDSVQSYVSQLGQSLIPAYQRELPTDAPQKIPFRFYVVIDESANAFALPNGIVVVHSGLVELLQNEAQLAAVVGHEVAHSVQEHSWRQMQYHKKKRLALGIASALATAYGQYSLADALTLVEGAVRNGHSRSLENQADRLGLEYMVAAGYDPREAPAVWKLMTKKHGLQSTNFFWSSHENQATRRSYLMNELKNNYRSLDYSAARTDEERFKSMQTAVVEAAQDRKKVKVR